MDVEYAKTYSLSHTCGMYVGLILALIMTYSHVLHKVFYKKCHYLATKKIFFYVLIYFIP